MLQVCTDLRAEVDELGAFLSALPAEVWARETGFMGWTPWDVVAHLHFFDLVSLVALEGEDAFAAERKRLVAGMAEGVSFKAVARERFGGMDAATLRAAWQTAACKLADTLGTAEPKRRLPWFGPDMGVQMFATARFMEIWAHGQEIYDLAGETRPYTDRIKNIATLGVKTFGWTFANRKREAPGPPPYVRLTAPSGALWEWQTPSETESVVGSAVDFCHVVTQGRNVADTALEVTGPVATEWMSIAQCFAGAAVDPPKPGSRGPHV
jgi:uncharacterized protein (TIGR03084 family)